MSDYLTIMVQRARGAASAVRPLVQPIFAPAPADLHALRDTLGGTAPAPEGTTGVGSVPRAGRHEFAPVYSPQPPPPAGKQPAAPPDPLPPAVGTPRRAAAPHPAPTAPPDLPAGTPPLLPASARPPPTFPPPAAEMIEQVVERAVASSADEAPVDYQVPPVAEPSPAAATSDSVHASPIVITPMTHQAASPTPAPPDHPPRQAGAPPSDGGRIVPLPRPSDRPPPRLERGSAPAWLATRDEVPAPPTIRVSIGRIEVRAVLPAPAPPPPTPPAPLLTLEAYLRERTGRQDR